MRTVLVLLIALALPSWGESLVTIGEVQWYTDYDQALKVAKKQNKPLWLHFGENPG